MISKALYPLNVDWPYYYQQHDLSWDALISLVDEDALSFAGPFIYQAITAKMDMVLRVLNQRLIFLSCHDDSVEEYSLYGLRVILLRAIDQLTTLPIDTLDHVLVIKSIYLETITTLLRETNDINLATLVLHRLQLQISNFRDSAHSLTEPPLDELFHDSIMSQCYRGFLFLLSPCTVLSHNFKCTLVDESGGLRLRIVVNLNLELLSSLVQTCLQPLQHFAAQNNISLLLRYFPTALTFLGGTRGVLGLYFKIHPLKHRYLVRRQLDKSLMLLQKTFK